MIIYVGKPKYFYRYLMDKKSVMYAIGALVLILIVALWL